MDTVIDQLTAGFHNLRSFNYPQGNHILIFCLSICSFVQSYVQSMREVLVSESWKVPTSICWGMRDRWLSYDGVEEFCKASNNKLVELPMVQSLSSPPSLLH